MLFSVFASDGVDGESLENVHRQDQDFDNYAKVKDAVHEELRGSSTPQKHLESTWKTIENIQETTAPGKHLGTSFQI